MSLLVLERGMAGFERGRNLDKIGMHARTPPSCSSPTCGCRSANLLGDRGQGFTHLTANLAQERLSIAVTGVARRPGRPRLDPRLREGAHGVRPAHRRRSRTPSSCWPRCATEVEMAEAFVDRCVLALNAGTLTAEEAAMAKWWCTELQKRVIDRCLQLHGGYGYMPSTRSPGPTPTPASPPSTAAPPRS
jgi:alkylation response protein AidB-like acyl-CoA dehydrogenase